MFQALCSLLRRDASINFKAKGNSLVSVLACNLLMAAYEEDENWPEIFVKVVESRALLLASDSGGQARRHWPRWGDVRWESKRAAEELFPLQVKGVSSGPVPSAGHAAGGGREWARAVLTRGKSQSC